jgi:hypothetical protein
VKGTHQQIDEANNTCESRRLSAIKSEETGLRGAPSPNQETPRRTDGRWRNARVKAANRCTAPNKLQGQAFTIYHTQAKFDLQVNPSETWVFGPVCATGQCENGARSAVVRGTRNMDGPHFAPSGDKGRRGRPFRRPQFPLRPRGGTKRHFRLAAIKNATEAFRTGCGRRAGGSGAGRRLESRPTADPAPFLATPTPRPIMLCRRLQPHRPLVAPLGKWPRFAIMRVCSSSLRCFGGRGIVSIAVVQGA